MLDECSELAGVESGEGEAIVSPAVFRRFASLLKDLMRMNQEPPSLMDWCRATIRVQFMKGWDVVANRPITEDKLDLLNLPPFLKKYVGMKLTNFRSLGNRVHPDLQC